MTSLARTDASDLLAPVLAERDDATGFRGQPWNPWTLIVWSVFAMSLGTGLLYAVNFHRLGQRRAVAPCALAFLALALLQTWIDLGLDQETRQAWSLVLRAVPAVAGAAVAYLQQHRFHVFVQSAGEPASTLVPGVLAVAVGIAGHSALGVGLTLALGLPR